MAPLAKLSKTSLAVGEPTPEQVEAFNRYLPLGLKPVEAAELAIVPFLAADNLVNRGLGRWDINELDVLPEFALGLPFMLNHSEDVKDIHGVCIGAKTFAFANPKEWAIDRAGNGDLNREIVEREGYAATIVLVGFSISSPILERMRFGATSVSFGGIRVRDYWCPICDTSFLDRKCPHKIPDDYYNWALGIEGEKYAPYYDRKGTYDLCELSLVWAGNLPAAGALTALRIE